MTPFNLSMQMLRQVDGNGSLQKHITIWISNVEYKPFCFLAFIENEYLLETKISTFFLICPFLEDMNSKNIVRLFKPAII